MLAPFRVARVVGSALVALSLLSPQGAAQICAGKVHDAALGGRVFDTGGGLYASGGFDLGVWKVAQFTGSGWNLLPGEFDGDIRSVAQTSFGLIAAGAFENVDGAPRARIARFDGQAWHALAGGIDGPSAHVREVHEHAGKLYAGGDFAAADGVPSPNIASFDGLAWSAVLGGTDGPVRALASYAGELVVGGDFDHAGGLELPNIAQWDGAGWSSLGTLAPVWDLEVSGTRLYAGSGTLQLYAGGRWEPVGSLSDIDVRSIAIAPSGIYVHGPLLGFCLTWTDDPCLQRARFDAGSWTLLGHDEFTPYIPGLSLAAHGEVVYETGGSEGMRAYSTAPKLHSWSPAHGPWYAATQLTLNFTCLDPLAPAQLWFDGQPLATSIVGPNTVSATMPASVTQATGPLELRFEQGGETIVVPKGFVSRPELVVQTSALFAQVIRFYVKSGTGVGTAWILISGQGSPQQLALPGVHALLDLDLASGFVLGAGALGPDNVIPATLGFVLPLGTFPIGLKFRAQAFVAEQTQSGLRLAFTNAVDEVVP